MIPAADKKPPRPAAKILLADDNPHAQRMGAEILEQEGYEVTAVPTGDEAMVHLSEHRPALVLVDTRMPGPSGFEICRHIRENPSFAHTKVVLLTGPLDPARGDDDAEKLFDGFAQKPLDAALLLETVRSLIGAPGEAPADDSAIDAPDGSREIAAEESVEADVEGEPSWTPDFLGGEAEEASAAQPPPVAEYEAEPAVEETGSALIRPDVPVADSPAEAGSGDDSPPESLDASSAELDQLAAIVQGALAGPDDDERRRRVRAAVIEVLDEVIPDIADRVADRLMKSLNDG